jgi:Phosphatidylserine decarboxylase
MLGSIEISFISPISNYSFDKHYYKYYLVFINTTRDNNIFIYKIELPTIDNITDVVRSYAVGKSLKIAESEEYPYYEIKLFRHQLTDNKICLLFTGTIELNKLETNGISTVTLKAPSKVLDELRWTYYTDMTSFLEEQFFNFESTEDQNQCILFIIKIMKTDKELINPFIFKFDMSPDIYIYDRYVNEVIKEFVPQNLKKIMRKNRHHRISPQYIFHLQNLYFKTHYCQGSYDNYLQYVKEYQLDLNKYYEVKENHQNFLSMFTRKINQNYRPIRFDPYLNNVILSPSDGRVRGFLVNETLKFSLFSYQLEMPEFITQPYELINGSGFMNRITPTDYQRVYLSYSGYLKEVGIYGEINKPYIITLKFDNEYFMPPDVHEREYISVIYGHNVHTSRAYPELVEVQPKTTLIHYLILIGTNYDDSIIFTNNKLLKMKEIIKLNTTYRIKPMWMEQGEEVATFGCGSGYVISLFNRQIDFTSDIKYYSKMDTDQPLYKPIDCFVKLRDIVGVII